MSRDLSTSPISIKVRPEATEGKDPILLTVLNSNDNLRSGLIHWLDSAIRDSSFAPESDIRIAAAKNSEELSREVGELLAGDFANNTEELIPSLNIINWRKGGGEAKKFRGYLDSQNEKLDRENINDVVTLHSDNRQASDPPETSDAHDFRFVHAPDETLTQSVLDIWREHDDPFITMTPNTITDQAYSLISAFTEELFSSSD